MIDLSILPKLNVFFNVVSTLTLLGALHAIKQKNVERHRQFIMATLVVAVFFLASYLTYTFAVGHSKYQGEGLSKLIFLAVLLTHTLCAVSMVVLVPITLYRGWKRQDAAHRKIARITFPIWLYVSVTGALIYYLVGY